MQPFSTGVYVNFMSDEPADRLRAVYGPDKYERLVALGAATTRESCSPVEPLQSVLSTGLSLSG